MSALDWQREGGNWPHRQCSRFVIADGLRWHVQRMGAGPGLLLIHGTGAATHSWRGLLPLLARRFDVVAADLPGHGFSAPLNGPASLPAMVQAHAALLAALRFEPRYLVGHSAGAAIAAGLALREAATVARVVSLNGALLPFAGPAGLLFAPLARLLAATPLAAAWFARRAADPRAVQRLVASTGSTLDAEGLALYGRLLRQRGHVQGALAMMAAWDLRPLTARLHQLAERLTLICSSGDRTVPAGVAERTLAHAPEARLLRISALGHLAHEEAAAPVAALLDTALA